ncbi:bifunctional UDP-sugar hydrolase/5'-nucleotidase [Actinotalea sp. K2]|uniref:bifunctional metallophosphatase/5'-nucleotidase n=1 Tax=Actinotalea sp. K2 TaxID=2939438 RepID=UPI002017BDD3|nr:bifunctional UDP-sugar hydrolase/5'-nucleotidase [Actinotalea sp. K2]MCL3861033.1 bifunctional metallophosphatase/5'-nucleotidase [Actinotalea sp. K2]
MDPTRTSPGRRRRALPAALALTLVGTALTPVLATSAAAAEGDKVLQIVGINDFHGRIEANPGPFNLEAGIASIAGAVNQLRSENPSTVFVSAGDNIGASTFTSFSQRDEPTIDALNAAGLQVTTVGNHEFDTGFADLTERVVPRADFPHLGANVYFSATGEPALPEFEVIDVDGIDVGFIGVVTQQTASMVTPAGIAGLEFGDPLTAVNRVAAQLQDGEEGNGEADVLVVLTHDGAETDSCADLAAADNGVADLIREADPGVRAIFTGHTHRQYACSFPVPGLDGAERAVVQGSEYGKHLARVQITVDADGEVTEVVPDVLPMYDGGALIYPEDPTVAAIVAAAAAQAEVVGSVPVGRITGDIRRAVTETGSEDRGAESSLGNLVADMQLWATSNDTFAGTPAQIAFMNPGGLRADLIHTGDGTVTYRQVASVQPFANTLVTARFTGAQVKAVLEEQWQPDGSSRPKLHLGVSEGFSYTYDPDAPRGERITSMTYQGAPVGLAETYVVVMNSFLASGGDNFATLAQGADVTDTGQVDLLAAVEYFEEFEVVDPAPVGRATVGQGGGDDTPWAEVTLAVDRVKAGWRLPFTVTGLEPGQEITVTLDPGATLLGTFTASAQGVVDGSVIVPGRTSPGSYALVIGSGDLTPVVTPFEVTRRPASTPPGHGPGKPGWGSHGPGKPGWGSHGPGKPGWVSHGPGKPGAGLHGPGKPAVHCKAVHGSKFRV